MAGYPITCPESVSAVKTSLLIMHSVVPEGAFPTIRHNEIRNLTGTLLTQVCHDVSLEPPLQPLSGEVMNNATSNRQDEARLAARDFWSSGQKALLTSRCSTHMPSPTRSSLLHPVSAIMRSRRKESTNKE